MTTLKLRYPVVEQERSSQRANELADRLRKGADALASFASGLTADEWNTPLPHDGRKIGIVVHHVATMYRSKSNSQQRWRGDKQSPA